MTTIVTRSGKGSPLTHTEVDTNFTNLNTAKLEAGAIALGSAATPSISFTGDTNTGIYSPGADQVAVATNGTGRLFIGSDGSVGVGTSALATVPLLLNDTGNGLVLQNAASGNYAIGLLAGTGSQDAYIYQRANAPLIIGTNNTERARIDSSGRLLVGTSSVRILFFAGGASTLAQIEGNSTATASLSITRNDATADGNALVLAKARGTAYQILQYVNGTTNDDRIGRISFQGADGTNMISGAEINAFVDGTPGANDMPGRLVFSTTADGGSSPTERMRITATGLVSIKSDSGLANGIKFDNGATSSSHHYDRIYFGAASYYIINNSGVGVRLDNGATSWSAQSDERLKTNLTEISDGLGKIGTLRAVTGRYLNDETTVSRSFLIAQDVRDVLPEAVSEDNDDSGTLNLRYTEVIPLLVAALKESKERIEQLETEMAAVKAQLA